MAFRGVQGSLYWNRSFEIVYQGSQFEKCVTGVTLKPIAMFPNLTGDILKSVALAPNLTGVT
jgi:hypothetical protein